MSALRVSALVRVGSLGDVQVIRPTGSRVDVESWDRLIDSVATPNGLRLVIDFRTPGI